MKGASTQPLKDPPADIRSFFKCMIGDDFAEVLFLPPKYARTVSKLVNAKFVLEDANGLKWTVTLSKIKGHFAFQKGWNAFSEGHGLEFGDFLVFTILKHAHFLVKVYGRSACEKVSFPEQNENRKKRKRTKETSSEKNNYFPEMDSDDLNGSACEKVSFPEQKENRKKRKRTKETSSEKNNYFPEMDSDDLNGHHSTPVIMDHTPNTDSGNNLMVLSQTNYNDESFYMINRDIGGEQGETRVSLYDLASIEMSPCDFSGSHKGVPENDRIANLESEVSTVGEIPVAKEVENCLPISVIPNVEIMQKSRDVGQIDKMTPFQKNDSENKIPPGQKQDSNGISGKEKVPMYQRQQSAVKTRRQNAEKNVAVGIDFSDLAFSFKPEANSSGKDLKEVKQEQLEIIKEAACVPGELPGKEKVSVYQRQEAAVKTTGQNAEKNVAFGLDFSDLAFSFNPGANSSGKGLKEVKQEQLEIMKEACIPGESPGKEKVSVYQRQEAAVKTSDRNAETNVAVGLDFSDLACSFNPGANSSGNGLKVVKQEDEEIIEEEACVPGELLGKSFNVVEQKQVEWNEEGFVYGGEPGKQWMMKLDESSYPSVEACDDVPLVVKAEPVQTFDYIPHVVVRCIIPLSEQPDKQPFLELPDMLFPITSRTRQSSGRAVVYLRGPITGVSMWPVLYLEISRRMLLTSGWDAFRKANGFSAGEECVFCREDQFEYIFRVTKVPK